MGIENITFGQSFNDFTTRVGKAGDSASNEKFSVATNANNYKPNFINLGTSYTEYLGKKFGNGDKKLTLEEFKKSQLAPLSDKDKKNKTFIKATENTFNNINLNNDTFIDAKEMTALLALFDQNYESMEIDGQINARDITYHTLELSENPSNFYAKSAKQELKSIYQSIFSK